MVKLKLYLVSYDQCLHQAVKNLTKDERSNVKCYGVGEGKFKMITAPIDIINEWQLPWHNNRYQFMQYYEYSILPHTVKNPELSKDLTHIGMLHNDVLFHKNSVNELYEKFDTNPNQIFYVEKRGNDVLYFSRDQLGYLSRYLESKLNITVNDNDIWNNGWISQSMAVMPAQTFLKFGQFILDYQFELENMLNTNKWGLMNRVKHRICGLVERLWGIYLMSCELPTSKMNAIHDHASYAHAHLEDKQKFLKNFQ